MVQSQGTFTITASIQLHKCTVHMIDRTYAHLIEEQFPGRSSDMSAMIRQGRQIVTLSVRERLSMWVTVISFFPYGESTPHRVPIGPERPTVLQVIVALGRTQIDPISTPTRSRSEMERGYGRKEEGREEENRWQRGNEEKRIERKNTTRKKTRYAEMEKEENV